MSIYAMAVQSGVNLLTKAGEADAFNVGYANQAKRLSGRNRISAIQRNMAAVRQDKILTNKAIQVEQSQAEAMVKLSAAVSGVTGGSVDDVKYMTQVNKVNASKALDRNSDQALEQLGAEISNTQATLLGVTDTKYSGLGNVLGAASQLTKEDWQEFGKATKFFGG